METISASMLIEVHVDCPHCSCFINLMDESHTNGRDHDEEGGVIRQAVPDGSWHDKHKEFSVSNVTCSECKESFNVEGLDW